MAACTVLLLLGSVAACEDPLACTLRGCQDRLEVVPPASAEVPFTVELSSSQGVRQAECAEAEASCTRSIMFLGFDPDTVQVRFVAPGVELVREFVPEYEREFPNGPECDEGCRRGTIAL